MTGRDDDAHLSAAQSATLAAVRRRFEARDAALGKRLFSPHDWKRVEFALSLSSGLSRFADIGIGQGQLVNCLAASPGAARVIGFDFRKHTKLLEPAGDAAYEFIQWDVTAEPPVAPGLVDLVYAMEIFEHIEPAALPAACKRARALSSTGSMFVTVPWNETEPLYHHDRPSGHKQSFNDDKIVEFFGPSVIWSQYQSRWYLAFTSERLECAGAMEIENLLVEARRSLASGSR